MEETLARPVTCASSSTRMVDQDPHTHTCDLDPVHRGAHRCPSPGCGALWVPARSYHHNHPYQ